jgi:hypothetical protein
MNLTDQFKALAKSRSPILFLWVKKTNKKIKLLVYNFRLFIYSRKPIKDVFSDIYSNQGWGKLNSVSGAGSDLIQTAKVREKIPILIREFYIKSLLDAPCGDFYWLKEVQLNLDRYIGADIVSKLVIENQQKYGNEYRRFLQLDITGDQLPQVDLILCRDCLVHLSFKNITLAIKNFKQSSSTYLLTTTYPGLLQQNKDITTGDWRPIDLQLPPFNFPKPIKLINEATTEVGDHREKSLGLWKLENIQCDE